MSIIIGVKTEKYIVIAADKRIISSDGTFTDTNNKLSLVNKNVAFAGAGNYAFIEGVCKKLKESVNTKRMTVEDILEIVKSEYKLTKVACRLKKHMNSSFIDSSTSCCCFIAGLNKSNEPKLIFASDESDKGYLSYCEVQQLLITPRDVMHNECLKLFERNLMMDSIGFAEKTIKDIAKTSKYISSTGDKWAYDLNRKQGKLESF